MCGISGIFYFNKNNDNSLIKKMTSAMAHRGPDAEAFYNDEQISFGHRRLSIIDLSNAATQPMCSVDENYIIVFNGEIYNYKTVKEKITDYDFQTSSDTEVILAGYIKYGVKILDHLIGMFAFAIYDKKNNEIFIARDRLGVKPIYYYIDDNHFIFSSELRSMLATGLIEKKLNTQAIQEYLATQSFPAPISILQNVKQFEAGNYAIIKNKKIAIHKYWDITEPKHKFNIDSKEEAKKEIFKLLNTSIERRLVADVPVAAFLSGGIDSSIVVGLMSQHTNSPQTFNIAFNEKDYDESEYAEIIAKKFNTKHHKILLTPNDFLQELPNALNAIDTPSVDGINSYVVSKYIVKNGIKVAMSGVGGDELFAGYPGFKQWYSINNKKWIWNIPTSVRKMASSFLSDTKKNNRIKKLLETKELNLETFYALVRHIMTKDQIENLISSAYTPLPSKVNGNYKNFPLLSQYSIFELLNYTTDTLLKDTDQFSMAVSLEVREPFFDHELIEYVLQVPDTIKYPSYPKSLLVESVGDLLPKEIVHREKKGFTFPWEHWMRNELKSFCEEHINNLSKREIFNELNVQNFWKNFLQNSQIKWAEIWALVLLDTWLQKNFD